MSNSSFQNPQENSKVDSSLSKEASSNEEKFSSVKEDSSNTDNSSSVKATASNEEKSSSSKSKKPKAKTKMPILEVRNLSKFYYEKSFFTKKDTVVDRVTFNLYKGEILGITGNNSCGKSTLAGMLSGSIEPDSGSITFDGKNLHYGDMKFRRDYIRLADIALVEQFSLPIDVNDFLDITLEVIGIDEQFRGEIITNTLKSVHASPNLGTKSLSRLNKQEQSLVALSHALILRPKILVFDDLFATVDLSFKGVLVNILLELQANGTTIVMITSDLGIIKHIADRIMILQDGVIEDLGDTYDVLINSESEFTSRLVKSYFGRSLSPSDWIYSIDANKYLGS